jgi:hypothetical protein
MFPVSNVHMALWQHYQTNLLQGAVIPGKLTGVQLVKNSKGPESLLSTSQETATGSYTGLDESNPHSYTIFYKGQF